MNFQVDEATFTELKTYPAVISSSIERYRFREALELMNVARLGNKYLADGAWKMIKPTKVVYKHRCMLPCKLLLLWVHFVRPFLPLQQRIIWNSENWRKNCWNTVQKLQIWLPQDTKLVKRNCFCQNWRWRNPETNRQTRNYKTANKAEKQSSGTRKEQSVWWFL
jgi:methionyl-tRNA synthetase